MLKRFLPVLDSNLQDEISGIKGGTTNLKLLKNNQNTL